jgi:signal transduction histidine kinase
LLVDDEVTIHQMLGSVLGKLGYRTTSCFNGEEAVARFRSSWQEIDLVILDVMMPGMSGPETLAALRQIDPQVRVVLSSGAGNEQLVEQAIQEGALAALTKPYRRPQVRAAIERALAGRQLLHEPVQENRLSAADQEQAGQPGPASVREPVVLATPEEIKITALTRGLSHWLGNNLFSISSAVDDLLDDQDLGDDQRQILEGILDDVTQISRAVQKLRQLGKRPEPDLVPVAPAELISLAVTAVGARVAGAVELRQSDCDTLPAVLADRKLVSNALCSLIRNAAEASEPGGTVTISAQICRDGQCIGIAVADQGKGVPEWARERIFEPYHTTKTGHLGLGLTLARRDVALHGGTISLASGEQGGSVFTVQLPIAGEV